MIKAVIVDFDDTLCLTQAACFKLENETLRRMGRSPMSLEIHKSTWGMPMYEAISLRSPGIDPDEFIKVHPVVHEEFVGRGEVDVVTDENLKTLDKLVSLNKKVMILTSRTETEAKFLLAPTHALAQRITAFYHKGNTTHHKPDPRVFGVIERDHGFSARECVYIGDSLSDAAAANGANLHFIANLESSLKRRSDFDGYKVEAFIDTFADLYQAVIDLDAKKADAAHNHEGTGLIA